MVSSIKKYRSIAILLIITFALGRFSSPQKTEIKEVEKVVYKERSETKRDVKRTVKKKETINPDGSKTIETETETDSSTRKNVDKSLDSEKSKHTKTESRADWYLVGMYQPDIQMYGLGIQRRIISEVYLGAYAFQDRTYGISIGVGF